DRAQPYFPIGDEPVRDHVARFIRHLGRVALDPERKPGIPDIRGHQPSRGLNHTDSGTGGLRQLTEPERRGAEFENPRNDVQPTSAVEPGSLRLLRRGIHPTADALAVLSPLAELIQAQGESRETQ